MSVINSQPLIGASGNQGGAYNLTRSLRFRSSASAYLNRTPASAGNRKTWTWSAWVKRGKLATDYGLFSAGTNSSNNIDAIEFNSSDQLRIYSYNTSYTFQYITTQVFRDPSAWYHIIVAVDTTQATAGDRVKVYVNGVQVTSFGTQTNPSLNADCQYFNNTNTHAIGSTFTDSRYFDGYIAENHFVNASALTPSSFGETDTATGVWKPKKYTGTYGTNGFYLKFDNLTSTSTLGNDSSGNSNTWTVNNISLTSGSTYDSMKDVPTLTDADTANYAVFSSIASRMNVGSITDGNLTVSTYSGNSIKRASFGVTTGKWYWEITNTGGASPTSAMIGICEYSKAVDVSAFTESGFISYYASGEKYVNGTGSSYGASYTTNDVIGVALDIDGGTVTFYKNNSSQGAITLASITTFVPFLANGSGSSDTTYASNFGQRPFAYTPPSGFKALNTFNLPTPTIGATASTQANKYFDVLTWTGDNSTANATKNRTGLNFQPDLVWIKNRSNAYSHNIYDAVRGAGSSKDLQSDTTNSESGNASNAALYGYVSAFNSDGFQTTNGTDASSGGIWVNQSSQTYVAWAWDANGTGSSNTAGTITSTVSANTTAGFSIATYTGNGTGGATFGHGLGVAPSMVIVKNRTDAGSQWIVFHTTLGGTKFLYLDGTDAAQTASGAWNNTAPSSTLVTLGTSSYVNGSTKNYVAYCFAEVAGYSKFGSYTGNGSTDGTFVFTGFRPKYILIKRTDAAYSWWINDSARDTYNVAGKDLAANLSDAESNDAPVQDFLSNGFKLRTSAYPGFNANGGTYIYAAFAESPFKYSLAR